MKGILIMLRIVYGVDSYIVIENKETLGFRIVSGEGELIKAFTTYKELKKFLKKKFKKLGSEFNNFNKDKI